MKHPIQPSPELVSQCMEMFRSGTRMEAMCEVSAQWGADQELEACCDTLRRHAMWDLAVYELMNDRRPKPPSLLRKQALAVLDDCSDRLDGAHENTIRLALEQLPND